jgi:hypothetical protein
VTLDCGGHTIVYGNQSGGSSYGIYADSKSNVVMQNCTITSGAASMEGDKRMGIYMISVSGSLIAHVNASYNKRYGVFFDFYSSGNRLNDSMLSENGRSDIEIYPHIEACSNSIINVNGSGGRPIALYNYSIELSDEVFSELLLCNANNSNLTNVTVSGSDSLKNNQFLILLTSDSTFSYINSSYNYAGMNLSGSSGNTFSNVSAVGNYENLILDVAGAPWVYSDNNVFIDSTLTSPAYYGVFLQRYAYNTTLINVTYENESVSSGSGHSLVRKWYVTVNASNSTGEPLQGLGVYFYNNSNGFLASAVQIGTDGLTERLSLVQYENSLGWPAYWNYTLYVNDTTGTYDNYTNATVSFDTNIRIDVVMSVDTNAPDLNFVPPTLPNNSYTQNASYVFVNVSATETLSACRLDNTTVNQTMSINGTYCYLNMTGLANMTSVYFRVYGNDTKGNLNVTGWRNVTVNITAYYDTNAPDIFGVSNATIYPIRAYISWNTTEDANSSVLLGINASLLSVNASNSSMLSFRNLTVQYLSKNTTYYYNVSSCDAAGNCNTTGPYTFATPECNASWSEGSWSTCSSGSQSRTLTDLNQCQYPWETEETQSCEEDGGGNNGGNNGGPTTPPANVSSRPDLVPGIGIINNSKLLDAIENVLEKANLSSAARENLLRLSESITADTTALRNMTYSGGRTKLQTRLRYSGTKRATNFMVYEKLPKAFAERARDVTITCPGASFMVVEEDPAWLITYPEVSPGQELLITYDVSGSKPSSVSGLTQTEIYAETLSEAAAPADGGEEPAVACTAGTWRCSGAVLEECSASGSRWIVLETCAHGCDDERHACRQEQPSGDGTWSSAAILSYAIFICGIVAFAVLLMAGTLYVRKKEKKKAAAPKKKAQEAKASASEMKAVHEAAQKPAGKKETHVHPSSEISKDIRDGEPDVAMASVAVEKHKATGRGIEFSELVTALKKIRSAVVRTDKPAGALAKVPQKDIAIATLVGVHKLVKQKQKKQKKKKGAALTAPSRKMAEADRKLKDMGALIEKVPQLHSTIEGLKKEISEHGKTVSEVRSMERSLREEMAEIRDSISALRDTVVKKSLEKDVERKEIEGILEKAADDINGKVSDISVRMEKTFSDLKEKISKPAQDGGSAASEPLSDLSRDIDAIRSQLPGFMVKKDSAASGGGEEKKEAQPQEKQAHASKAAASDLKSPGIAAAGKFVGKDIAVECTLRLFKSLDEPGMKIYWYKASDESGECILASKERIPDGKAAIQATVRKTGSGTVYLDYVRNL